MEFTEFPKIARWKRDVVVTEKIDGTNAQILIRDGKDSTVQHSLEVARVNALGMDLEIFAGSRNRFVTPGKDSDNQGFAAWVANNAVELAKLGVGTHFGEWWGHGIQRGYGLHEKRFSLFNVGRWVGNVALPECCFLVPVLCCCPVDGISGALADLKESGSVAAPGFMRPEGIVIYHAASRTLFKQTIERDEEWKGKQR